MKTDKTTEIVERLKEFQAWAEKTDADATSSGRAKAYARGVVKGLEIALEDLTALPEKVERYSIPTKELAERVASGLCNDCWLANATDASKGEMIVPGEIYAAAQELAARISDCNPPAPPTSAAAEPASDRWLCAGKCGQWKQGTPAAHNGSGPVCAECESASEAPAVEPGESEGFSDSEAKEIVIARLQQGNDQLRERVEAAEEVIEQSRLALRDASYAMNVLNPTAFTIYTHKCDEAVNALTAYRKLTTPTPAEAERTKVTES